MPRTAGRGGRSGGPPPSAPPPGGSNNNNNDDDGSDDNNENDPLFASLAVDDDGDANVVVWRERERRQRTVRVLMMFLLMLLLMDGEEQAGKNGHVSNRNRPGGGGGGGPGGLRKQRKGGAGAGMAGSGSGGIGGGGGRPLDPAVYAARRRQDELLGSIAVGHPRYRALVERNGGGDVELDVRKWAEQQAEQERDEFVESVMMTPGSGVDGDRRGGEAGGAAASASQAVRQMQRDPDEDRKVYHYPWNATGFYRGEWVRAGAGSNPGAGSSGNNHEIASSASREMAASSTLPAEAASGASSSKESASNANQRREELDAVALESDMLRTLKKRGDRVGVFVLPEGKAIKMRDDNNLTTLGWDSLTVDTAGRTYRPLLRNGNLKVVDLSSADVAPSAAGTDGPHRQKNQLDETDFGGGRPHPLLGSASGGVTLSKDSGRVAFQIFSRSIPSMKELSLVDGFVKLYDSNSPGFSTRKDMLLRVRGVIIHSIGRISLVSNVDVSRSALVIDGEPTAVDAGGDDGSGNSESDDASGEDDLDDGDGLDEEEEDRRRDRRRRRLMEALEEIEDDAEASKDPSLLGGAIDRIREEAVALFSGEASTSIKSSIQSPDWDENAEEEEEEAGAVSDGERVREEDGGVDGGDNKSDITEPSRAKSGSEDEDDAEEAPLRLATTFLARTEEEPSIMLFEDDSASTAETETTGSSQADSSSEGEDYAYGVPPQLATTFLDRTDEEVSIMMFNDDSTSMTTRRMLGRNSVGAGSLGSKLPPWSDIVMPYPFVRDDKSENIRKTRTPAARRMPPREQLLEANAASCEFEINMDVQETEWTVGAWRNLLTRRFREAKKLDPASQEQSVADSDAEAIAEKIDPRSSIRGSRSKTRQDQALVMTIIGTIHSDNCNFHAALNATALRTDWEATTAKAINYSMYMTLVCLTQMLVLLRQLLHSQSQSAATRVSLLCVGWQTVIDALLCLVHIYLSLAMQPLFTAFASVAFFKLLIFCVIEMKYMAMVIQARNSSNGGQTTEVLRRQIALLHLRFYLALLGTFLLVFYIGERYRIVYALALYSFWVPQIILNIYTEARTPLHNHYIYGMSVSRLVAPLYTFAVGNNFLKEVYPDFTSDTFMCEALVLWVGLQSAVLIAQGKLGARFMIPARFLPPKFDYSRPLPPSMLPPGAQDQQQVPPSPSYSPTEKISRGSNVSDALTSSSDADSLVPGGAMVGDSGLSLSSSPPRTDRHTTAVTTRNRMRGSRARRNKEQKSTRMTKEGVVRVDEEEEDAQLSSSVPPQHALDCSICYDNIDIRNRSGYMLAPCDHIFHRDCLVQWMDVKMECPICRMELPAL